MKTAVYYRSGTDQKMSGNTMEEQKKQLESYADKHGMEIMKSYSEDTDFVEMPGCSGLEAMKKDIQAGEIDTVLVLNKDSLSEELSSEELHQVTVCEVDQ